MDVMPWSWVSGLEQRPEAFLLEMPVARGAFRHSLGLHRCQRDAIGQAVFLIRALGVEL
jgi:hypothetical protein